MCGLEFGQNRDIIVLLLIFLHRKCSQCIQIYANSFVKDIYFLKVSLGLVTLNNSARTKIVNLRARANVAIVSEGCLVHAINIIS